MPSTDTPFLGLVVVVLLVTGCGTATPSATLPDPTPAAATATSDSSPSEEVEPQLRPQVLALPEPGRPFDAAALLAAMRESRRPGGVPDHIETDAIASALASAIWTFDGRPWTTIAAGGSCGPETCTLEFAGARADMAGDDLWVFAVSSVTGSIEVLAAELGALPAELPIVVDELVRSSDADASLAGMLLASLKWLPPPDDGRFLASYRSGGEEGSCSVDVTLASNGTIVSELSTGC